ncbi:hypothetical protein [Aquitalea magnusonii]|uniref:hypothetical protein n=1 Tax=Aquitalea magnusonii TaxID=332411 RepID=UPI0023BB0F56|nr:hypothetical protein [Aquitalea magnusonii]
MAYYGGVLTGKQSGLADISLFSGIGLMGGAMLRIAAAASRHGSRKPKPHKTHWPDTGATSCKCWKKYWHTTGW